MFMYLIIFLGFFAVIAGCMISGFWANILTFINVLFAGLIAVATYEPLSSWMTNLEMIVNDPSIAALREKKVFEIDVLPFFFLWGIFIAAFIVLRALTDYFSRYQVRFHIAVEWTGRVVMSIAVALLFLSFAAHTVHVAPMTETEVGSFQQTPESTNFLFGPDKMWLGYCHYASRNSLSEFRGGLMLPEVTGNEHPDDASKSLRVFDSRAEFVIKHKYLRTERLPTATRKEK